MITVERHEKGLKIFKNVAEKQQVTLSFIGERQLKEYFLSPSQARAIEYSKAWHHRMNEARRSSEYVERRYKVC